MSTSTHPVVVGIDGQHPGVLRFAIDEALMARSPLRVVHSAGISAQAADYYVGLEVLQDLRERGQGVLDEARVQVEREAPGLQVDYVLTSRAPLEALEHESSAARLVVVGADDVPWIDRLLRSKIAGHLALHSSSPVVVIPRGSGFDGLEGDVILALDGDSSAEGPIRFALDEAVGRKVALHVLHATAPGSPAQQVEEERANLGEVLAGWREKFPEVVIIERFVPGDPVAAVTHATETAALVIVGRPHGQTVSFPTARPLATAVLRRTHCPVAVVPAHYAGA